MHAPRAGSRIGPYELHALIGAGGSGEVYRAHDTAKDRVVAVKVLRSEVAADPGVQQRIRRDAWRAARLHAQHVLAVHDCGELDGHFVIDMPLIDGPNLAEVLREHGALEPARAASICAQVASALDAAHADGLVHGNVKPENVLITRNGFAYLADFGFGDVAAGPGDDVYALAALLYECLAGEPPFGSVEPGERAMAPPPRPSIMRRGVPRAFDQVIARGLAPQPAARFGSAGELAAAAAAVVSADSPIVPPRTRPFETLYVDPDDTGASPYPSFEKSAVGGTAHGRTALLVTSAAVVVLLAALTVAMVSVFGGDRRHPPPAPSPTAAASPPAPTSTSKAPLLSRPVRGADGWGFVGETARCDPGNPPAAVVRTSKSLAVVCATAASKYYYRGERISDGANIQLAGAVRASGGFDVSNPADGTRYEVRPHRLRIISNGHVDSSEPVLQYASAD